MIRSPYRSCCKRSAIRAFQKGELYLVGCTTCHSLFSITDDLDLFIQQILAYHTLSPNHLNNFDALTYGRKIIFMLP